MLLSADLPFPIISRVLNSVTQTMLQHPHASCYEDKVSDTNSTTARDVTESACVITRSSAAM